MEIMSQVTVDGPQLNSKQIIVGQEEKEMKINRPKCYVARAMTGRVKEEVVAEALRDKEILEKAGFEVLCPVVEENVPSTKEVLRSSKKAMDQYWPRDKAMIREAHLVFNMSPHLPSLGVIREHGYSRYHLWKKVISVFPKGSLPMKAAVCYYEDDFVTDSLDYAIDDALKTHKTRYTRILWRLRFWPLALVKSNIEKIVELFK